MNPSEKGGALTEPASGLSRRTVVKGAAWAVPTVSLATAVPAYAASPADANLAVSVTDCALVTVRLLSENLPGFQYTVTEGPVLAGTEIEITAGGVASINASNFDLPTSVTLLGISGQTATFETQQDYNVGESFKIGLTGLTVNVLGSYTSRIITPDAVQDDDIVIMTTGGLGVGAIGTGAFICYDEADEDVDPIDDVDVDVVVDYNWCELVGILNTNAGFTIGVEGEGTLPAGTRFLLYSTSALSIGIGNWSFDDGADLGLGLLGIGGDAAEFETPRDITEDTPLVVEYTGALTVDIGSTYYLAYLGNDTDPSDNAKGMTVTGASLLGVTVASCEKLQG